MSYSVQTSSICQSSLAFLVGCYCLRAPWAIRKSRISFLKSTLKKPQQPVALGQILYCRKCCRRPASFQLVESEQNRILSFCPNSAQSPIFQCFRRFCVALCFHVALILVGIRRNRCLQMSKNSSDDFVNIFFDTNIISLYGLTFDGRQDSA